MLLGFLWGGSRRKNNEGGWEQIFNPRKVKGTEVVCLALRLALRSWGLWKFPLKKNPTFFPRNSSVYFVEKPTHTHFPHGASILLKWTKVLKKTNTKTQNTPKPHKPICRSWQVKQTGISSQTRTNFWKVHRSNLVTYKVSSSCLLAKLYSSCSVKVT